MRKALLLALLLVAPTVGAQWNSFHGDERNTGHLASYQYEPFVDVWWSIDAGARVEASPVVAEGKVIIADIGGTIHAYDHESGKELWKTKMPAGIFGTPAIDSDRLLVIDIKGNLWAIDLATGQKLFSANVGASRSGINVHDGRLYFGTEDGRVRSFDTNSLTEVWTFKVDSVYKDPQVWNNNTKEYECKGDKHPKHVIRTAPLVYKGIVVFGSWNEYVYAVQKEGEGDRTTPLLWTFKTDDGIWASPVVDHRRERIIIASTDEQVYSVPALPSQMGEDICIGYENELAWKNPYKVPSAIGLSEIQATPTIHDNALYIAAMNGLVISLYASNGTQGTIFPTGDAIVSSPALSNGILVVGNDQGEVYWLDGFRLRQLKTFEAGDAIKASIAVDGTRAFAASGDGKIYMFGPEIPHRSDLVVQSVTLDDKQVVATVVNVGQGASEPTKLRLEVDGQFLAERPVPALEPSGTLAITHFHNLDRGERTIRAIINPGPVFVEMDHSNNEAMAVNTIGAVAVDVPAPSLALFALVLAAVAFATRSPTRRK